MSAFLPAQALSLLASGAHLQRGVALLILRLDLRHLCDRGGMEGGELLSPVSAYGAGERRRRGCVSRVNRSIDRAARDARRVRDERG